MNGKKTPDLRGRFVIGYNPDRDNYQINGSGGKELYSQKLKVDQIPLPSHDHKYVDWFDSENADASYPINSTLKTDDSEGPGGGYRRRERTLKTSLSEAKDATAELVTMSLPPYYALAFIMRVD